MPDFPLSEDGTAWQFLKGLVDLAYAPGIPGRVTGLVNLVKAST